MLQRNWLGWGPVTHDRTRQPHQFFGLKSIAFTTAATLALCSAIELANSFGPPILTIWPVVSSRSLILLSAVTSRTSAAIFSLSCSDIDLSPNRPAISSISSEG